MINALQKQNASAEPWGFASEAVPFFWSLGHHDALDDLETKHSFVPSLDVKEDNESMNIIAELPGLSKDDVQIKVRDGVLRLSGEKKFSNEEGSSGNYYHVERRYGSFTRSFSLPNTVDPGKIHASMKDGVLRLVIPKRPEAKERNIDIKID